MNNRQSHISRKWYKEAVVLVDEYDFDLSTVYDNSFAPADVHGAPPVTNCQFCGQAIRYVAVIAGKPKFAESKNVANYKQIGCDCLEHVLGRNWKHFASAMRQLKVLVDAAKVESRKKRFAVKYKAYIDWIDSLPTWLIEKKEYNWSNRFILDMKRILTTGEKDFSKKMQMYMDNLMKDPRYDTSKVVETKSTVETEVRKMRELLAMIEKVDGNHIHDSYSAYGFVNSILNYAIKHNGASRSQLNALNKVWLRYTNRKKTELNDPTIPY